MKTGLSSFTISDALRATVLRTQAALLKAQTEMGSGRIADIGLTLGARAGRLVSFERQSGTLQAMLDANGITAARLDASQTALQAAAKTADGFQAALIAARAGTLSPDLLQARRATPCVRSLARLGRASRANTSLGA